MNAYQITKSKKVCQADVIEIWSEIKNSENLPNKVDSLIKEYRFKSMRHKGSLLQTWAKMINPSPKSTQTSSINESVAELEFAPSSSQFDEPDISEMDLHQPKTSTPVCASSSETKSKTTRSYVQIQLQKEIDVLNADICVMQDSYRSGLLSESQEKELKEKKLKKKELETDLKRKIQDAERSLKARQRKKARQEQAVDKYPGLREELKIRNGPGQPRLEDEQPLLLKTIIDLAIHGSASHEKRQNDLYRAVRTLDELTQQLQKEGFKISRSGVYLRPLPWRRLSTEGQRHVVTVPVK